MLDGIKLEEGFDLLDEDGNFMGLACLYLKEDRELFSGKLKGYNLRLKLLGQDNYFTVDEISSQKTSKSSTAQQNNKKTKTPDLHIKSTAQND